VRPDFGRRSNPATAARKPTVAVLEDPLRRPQVFETTIQRAFHGKVSMDEYISDDGNKASPSFVEGYVALKVDK
jgi:hypothetical protein